MAGHQHWPLPEVWNNNSFDRGCKTGVEGEFNTSDSVPLNNRNGMSSFITSHSSRYRRSEQPVVSGLIPKLLTAITNGSLVCISASISVYFHIVNRSFFLLIFFAYFFKLKSNNLTAQLFTI